MEEQETYEVVTPKRGHVVVLKSWITGRDKQKIDGSLFRNVETKGSGESITPQLSEDMIANQQNASIEAIVVSVDGVTEGILDLVLDMHVKDCDFIDQQIKKIIAGDLDEKKEGNFETNTSDSSKAEQDTSQIEDGQ